MSWVQIDDNFPNHPKVLQAGPVAAWLYVCGLCYCRKYHTGGFIPLSAVKTLGMNTNPRRLIDALIAVHLWARDGEGFRIHDYAAMYPDDAADKAKSEAALSRKREAGRLGGLASAAKRSAQAPAQASAQPNAQAETKQPASSGAQPHRVRDGSASVVVVLGERSGEGVERREPELHLDACLAELQRDYPQHRSTHGYLTESAFVEQFQRDARPHREVWNEMQANLAVNIRSYEWRVKGMVPKLEKYLREGLWKQQHVETPPSAIVSDKNARTFTAAAAFSQEDQ